MSGIYVEWAKEFLSRLVWITVVVSIVGAAVGISVYMFTTAGEIVANAVLSDPEDPIVFFTSTGVTAVSGLIVWIGYDSWDQVNTVSEVNTDHD